MKPLSSADARVSPSGEKAAEASGYRPGRMARDSPVPTSQSRTVRSLLADARVSRGAKATWRMTSSCPTSTPRGSPVSPSQSRTVRRNRPMPGCRPSGPKATDRTRSVCPASVRIRQPVAGSHNLMFSRTSRLPEAIASRRLGRPGSRPWPCDLARLGKHPRSVTPIRCASPATVAGGLRR